MNSPLSSNQLRRFNDRLGSDLGRVFNGEPRYKWIWSEDAALKHAMRVPDQYEYKADPETGLLQALPVYQIRKMAMDTQDQWVFCHWLPAPSESQWRAAFGYSLEWPRNGQYYPTDVRLDRGDELCAAVNDEVIRAYRRQSQISSARLERELLDTQAKREADASERQYQEILNDLPTYPSVPGSKGMVSYPSVITSADAE